MMEDRNIRAKIFISTDLIGNEGYCTWDEIWRVSRKHDIENHSHQHIRLDEIKDENKILWQIEKANMAIKQQVGRIPRFFVAPWNSYDKRVDKAAKSMGLQSLKDRINMKNISR
jgi:peptidoglycan/xylan/chitin deacetylase (PgdA/CDA1 family)